MDINKDELDKILAAVTEEWVALEKAESEAADIKKADDDEKKKAPKAEDSQPPAKDDKEGPPGKPSDEKEAAASKAPPAEGTMADAQDAGAKGDGSEAAAEGADKVTPEAEGVDSVGGEADPDQLCEMYMQLPPEHLAAHWMAASKAMFHQLHAGEMPEQEAEHVADAPGEDVQTEAGDKGEVDAPPFARSVQDSDEYKELIKKNETLEAQLSKLEKQSSDTAESLAKYLSQPNFKGFTAGNVLAKAEEEVKVLTKSDIKQLLSNKAKETLTPEDQKKLMHYTVNPVLTPDLKTFLGIK